MYHIFEAPWAYAKVKTTYHHFDDLNQFPSPKLTYKKKKSSLYSYKSQ